MKLKPIYNENIIVGVQFKHVFNWYVTDKELWYLDYIKYSDAYDIKIQDECLEERFGIQVLNNENASFFFRNINEYRVSENDLYVLLVEAKKANSTLDDLLNFAPVLYINFDDKMLYSMYPEPASYEEYVPIGWDGEYEDFTEYIDNSKKYWINSRGENLFLT